MKEGQTGKYGVWLSEFVQIAIASTRAGAWTDQQQQRRRQQKNGITRHTLWRRLQPPAPSRSSSGRRCILLLYYVLLALFVFQFFIHGYLQDHFHIPERIRNLLYGNICLSGIPRRLPK